MFTVDLRCGAWDGDAVVRVGTTTEKRPCLRRTRTSYYDNILLRMSRVGSMNFFFAQWNGVFLRKIVKATSFAGISIKVTRVDPLDPPADNATRAGPHGMRTAPEAVVAVSPSSLPAAKGLNRERYVRYSHAKTTTFPRTTTATTTVKVENKWSFFFFFVGVLSKQNNDRRYYDNM